MLQQVHELKAEICLTTERADLEKQEQTITAAGVQNVLQRTVARQIAELQAELRAAKQLCHCSKRSVEGLGWFNGQPRPTGGDLDDWLAAHGLETFAAQFKSDLSVSCVADLKHVSVEVCGA